MWTDDKANRWILSTYCEYTKIRRDYIYYLPLRHNWVSKVHNDDYGTDDNEGGCANLFLQKPPIIFIHTYKHRSLENLVEMHSSWYLKYVVGKVLLYYADICKSKNSIKSVWVTASEFADIEVDIYKLKNTDY